MIALQVEFKLGFIHLERGCGWSITNVSSRVDTFDSLGWINCLGWNFPFYSLEWFFWVPNSLFISFPVFRSFFFEIQNLSQTSDVRICVKRRVRRLLKTIFILGENTLYVANGKWLLSSILDNIIVVVLRVVVVGWITCKMYSVINYWKCYRKLNVRK